tara:strand:+ start:468 stop:689 length:222 start_codon:yes stop_codon:yes gene_type:complete
MDDKLFVTTADPKDLAESFIRNQQSLEINYRSIDQLFTISDKNGNALDVTDFSVTTNKDGEIEQVYIEVETDT